MSMVRFSMQFEVKEQKFSGLAFELSALYLNGSTERACDPPARLVIPILRSEKSLATLSEAQPMWVHTCVANGLASKLSGYQRGDFSEWFEAALGTRLGRTLESSHVLG